MNSILNSFTEVGKMGKEVWDKLLTIVPPSPPSKVHMISTPTRTSSIFKTKYEEDRLLNLVTNIHNKWNQNHLKFKVDMTLNKSYQQYADFNTYVRTRMVNGGYEAKVEIPVPDEFDTSQVIDCVHSVLVKMKDRLVEEVASRLEVKNEVKETEADRSGE